MLMNSDIIFEAENVSKKYKDCMALNQISFSIKRGEIFGLIGENGAGKTTLMKIISGCTNATSGKIAIMGISDRNIQAARKELGVIIETPAYYGDMTGYENMEYVHLAKDSKNKLEVDDVLKMVDLYDVRYRKVSKYSLGMRQRLGIGMALIGNPQFLVLDEPTNGLDPNGIVEIRNLIRRLNKEYGVTLLISSHILTELHHVSTRYGILHKGKMAALHTDHELQEKYRKSIVVIYEDNKSTILSFLSNFGIAAKAVSQNMIEFDCNDNLPENLLYLLIKQGFNIKEYYSKQETLEDYFLRLIQKGADENC